MGNVFYLIWSFLLLGFLSLNFQTYKYYHFQIVGNKKLKEKIRGFDLFFRVLSLWPLFLFLAPMFNFTEYCLLSAFVLLFFYCLSLLYSEYKLSKTNPKHNIYKPTMADAIFIILLFLMMMYYMLRIEYGEIMLSFLNLNFALLYLVMIKHIRAYRPVKTNSDKSLLCYMISVFNTVFYYICWGFAFIYLIMWFFAVFMEIADPDGIDTCADTGVCKEGYVFDDCGGGKPCKITKEYCISNNLVWYEKSRSCNTKISIAKDYRYNIMQYNKLYGSIRKVK